MAIWRPGLEGRRGPKYLQVVEAMAEDIASGRLPVGRRLPPYRELAYALGLSPHTVSRAYAEGVKRALLRGEVGRGTFVRVPNTRLDEGSAGDLVREPSGPINLARNLPVPGLAEPHLRRLLGELGQEKDLKALLDYQTDADLEHHSEAALVWLKRSGLEASSEEVVHSNGAQHGIFCALMALLRPGDLLLTEALTYAPVRIIAERLGIQTQPVAMDEGGLCPESFEKSCRTGAPKALYLTPTLQSPTTITLSEDRRRAIAEIARRHDVYLIEDDVFGPLKPDRPQPIATLASERTVYVTSLSKCVAPGLRVGYLRAPVNIAPALRQAVNLSVWMTPPITAEVAARLIRDGTADMLTQAQRAAAERRQALARALLGGGDLLADPHGMHLWLTLPERWKSDAFRAEAARRGVLVMEAGDFALRRAEAPNAIRLCVSHEVSEARLEKGLREIVALLAMPTTTSGLYI
jgi:DNA-binding transcriptional MocR family regulator